MWMVDVDGRCMVDLMLVAVVVAKQRADRLDEQADYS